MSSRWFPVVFLGVPIVLYNLITSSSLPPHTIALIAPVMLVLVLVLNRLEVRRRRARLARWAGSRGWTYAPQGTGLGLERLQRGTPFDRSGTVHHVLSGPVAGTTAVSFEHRTPGTGGRRQRVEQVHVVALRLPAVLPRLEVVPQGLGALIAGALGAAPTATGSPELDQAFRVVADDPAVARAVLHPATAERLLRADARDVAWRIEDGWLATWTQDALRTDVVAARLELLTDVVRHVPADVWHRYGGHEAVAGPAGTIGAPSDPKELS